MKSIVITGVSTGMGYGAAREFTSQGYRVWGSVRKREDGERLTAEFGPHFIPLLLDVTDPAAVQQAAAMVEQSLQGEPLAGLINNAGIAIAGPLLHQPLTEIRAHFEVNVLGLLTVTQAFGPLLKAQNHSAHRPGRIINISSVNGKIAAPFLGAYVGSKHAVEGISDTLRRELLRDGIDVIVIQPGTVQTEIWNKNATVLEKYAETDYAAPIAKFWNYALGLASKGYTTEQFGQYLRKVFEQPRPRPRYTLVPGKFLNFTLPRLLPDRTVDRLIAKSIGLK